MLRNDKCRRSSTKSTCGLRPVRPSLVTSIFIDARQKKCTHRRSTRWICTNFCTEKTQAVDFIEFSSWHTSCAVKTCHVAFHELSESIHLHHEQKLKWNRCRRSAVFCSGCQRRTPKGSSAFQRDNKMGRPDAHGCDGVGIRSRWPEAPASL